MFCASIVKDDATSFPSFIVKGKTLTDKRAFIADAAKTYLGALHKATRKGAVMFDIDDTLIDGHERCQHGFDAMASLYNTLESMYPIHVVTARPDDTKVKTLETLKKRGLVVPVDRLHIPTDVFRPSGHE